MRDDSDLFVLPHSYGSYVQVDVFSLLLFPRLSPSNTLFGIPSACVFIMAS